MNSAHADFVIEFLYQMINACLLLFILMVAAGAIYLAWRVVKYTCSLLR